VPLVPVEQQVLPVLLEAKVQQAQLDQKVQLDR
jgi:hypothetical protein